MRCDSADQKGAFPPRLCPSSAPHLLVATGSLPSPVVSGFLVAVPSEQPPGPGLSTFVLSKFWKDSYPALWLLEFYMASWDGAMEKPPRGLPEFKATQ